MTDNSQSPSVIWDEVVAEFIRLSDDPQSGYPPLTAGQRGFLSLAKPVTLVPGFAVIATPHAMSKKVIEQELGDSLARVLSRKMGQPYSLAVSIDPNPTDPLHADPMSEGRDVVGSGGRQAARDEVSRGDRSYDGIPANPQQEPVQQELPQQEPVHSQPLHSQHVQAELDFEQQRQIPWVETHARRDEYAGAEQPRHSSQPQRIPREKPAHNPNRELSLNPKYTFENFVIGSSNRFAHAAAVAVAESLARAYNPLFIWGGSGLGKTHLLHAIGNYAMVLQPGLRVKYVSSEEFTNDYINSVRDDRQESFKRRYRNLDILMVDDIQFLEGKEGTQEEFFHTFNALHQADKQIVLSSDRPPKQLTTLTDRLRTRFEAGLITDIQPPDLETRIAILSKKAQSDGTVVNREVLELIASRFESSIRELEGALIRVSAYASLVNEPIDSSLAEVALRDIMPDIDDVEITADSIMETTADYFNITLDALRGTGKTRAVAHARQLAMYLCRELTDLSLPRIGSHFGGKDHTTVMYADRKIRKEMTEKRDTYDQIQELTQIIKSKNRM